MFIDVELGAIRNVMTFVDVTKLWCAHQYDLKSSYPSNAWKMVALQSLDLPEGKNHSLPVLDTLNSSFPDSLKLTTHVPQYLEQGRLSGSGRLSLPTVLSSTRSGMRGEVRLSRSTGSCVAGFRSTEGKRELLSLDHPELSES